MSGIFFDSDLDLREYQILQQQDGRATLTLHGGIEAQSAEAERLHIFLRVTDENSGSDIMEPVYAAREGTRWCGTLSIPAGGPYSVAVAAFRSSDRRILAGDVIAHVGVGDLYLIAGQSNAVGYAKDAVWDPPSLDVHVLKLSGKWDVASHPLHDTTNSRYPRLSEQGRHSPWLQCGKILAWRLGYPIGLIPSAQGGLPLSCWDRREDGSMLELVKERIAEAGGKIRGILWYQGCSDTDTAEKRNTYLERFSFVCRELRAYTGAQTPFLTVQINKQLYIPIEKRAHAKNWSVLREAQRQAAHQIPGVYLIPSMDLNVGDTIHNTAYSNLVLGRRAAELLLEKEYGFPLCADAPELCEAVVRSPRCVVLRFAHARVIATDAYDPEGLVFEIEDALGYNAISAYACVENARMELTLSRPLQGEAYISCSRHSESGFMPYDLITRLPALAFDHIRICTKECESE